MPGRIDHILALATTTPWAIHEDYARIIGAVLTRRAAGEPASAETLRLAQERAAAIEAARDAAATASTNGVAVIPVLGVVSARASMLEQQSGMTSPEALGVAIDRAAADPGVKTIVLDVNSPGGTVAGTPELAAKIRAARSAKQVVAQVSYQAASAAYWIASQADEVVVSPSAEVGSIGVIAMHEDVSAKAKADGYAPTFITAGKYKAEAHPFAPLSEEARAEIQSKVDAAYEQFVGDVAKGRGVPVATARGAKFGQGRMVTAADAVARGMADRIATMDETLARFMGGGRVRSRTAAIAAEEPAEASPQAASAPAVRSDADLIELEIQAIPHGR